MLKKDAGPSFPWRPELLHHRLQVKQVSSAMLQICCPISREISHCWRFAGHLTEGHGRVNAYLRNPLVLPIWGVHEPTRTAYIPLAEPLFAWQQLRELKWPSNGCLPFLCSCCTPNCSSPSSWAQSCEAVWQCQRWERGKRGWRWNHCLVLLPSGCLPDARTCT